MCVQLAVFIELYVTVGLSFAEIPGQPKDLIVSQLWSRSIQLSWTAPYHGNRPILAYIVHYWKTEGIVPFFLIHDKTK